MDNVDKTKDNGCCGQENVAVQSIETVVSDRGDWEQITEVCCKDTVGAVECCNKSTERTDKERNALVHRLNRIAGQVNGIRNMLERNAYCVDILLQVSAVTAALNSFNKELLSEHIHHCVARDLREGKEETLDELITTVQKLMR